MYMYYSDPSISVSISGDVGEARAFRSSSSHEQSGKTVHHIYTFYHLIRFFFASQDEDSGDSDNEAEEQRKVCQLSLCYCRLCLRRTIHLPLLLIEEASSQEVVQVQGGEGEPVHSLSFGYQRQYHCQWY